MQRLVNAYVKTLKWIHTHTAAEIADKMPADYYAGDKDLYVTALQEQLGIFSPTARCRRAGPQSVLEIEQQVRLERQGQARRPEQDLHQRVRRQGQQVNMRRSAIRLPWSTGRPTAGG